MALDVSALKARKTEMPKREGTRVKRDLGPNPWLDANWDFSLKRSYDDAQAFELDFQGKMESTQLKRGKNKGQPTTKLTGDAADAVTLIRDAADKLNIGASIVTVPAVYAAGPNKGKSREGWFTVKYQGQKRKQRREKETAPAPGTAPAENKPA